MPRIVGGKARGRRIKNPPGRVRPATARVRSALFDHLAGFVRDARILDLYCGSGGLGLEALSRGASEAWFVDLSQRSIDVARENFRMLGFESKVRFICKDVFRFLNQLGDFTTDKFDLIFAAPPYRIAEPERILTSIAAAGAVGQESAVCLEYSRHTDHPTSSQFKLKRRKIYGETVVDVWDYIRKVR